MENCSTLMQTNVPRQQMDPQFVFITLFEASVIKHIIEHIDFPNKKKNHLKNS
jgi:hypothetical protein